ncbi:Mth938-like domain-containing protein [Sphingomonas sp. 35-24ZXX]|uniref:Mth938-like domain-containing protein n=1 Tax=Sphingomonas sp. 35-24ZXX TaxID=1545915 RepID=UPI00053BF504|nr:Mth938-like domain-containing protein [Sphingomonas sp. 35-24ZXX]
MAEFNQDPRASGPVITGFTAHGFKLDGDNLGPRRVESSLVLTPVSAMPWDAPALEALGIDAMAQVLDLSPAPEFMLLGTGAALAHPPRAFIQVMEERGIGVEVMDSRAAARAWGILRSEDRWIAAAIMGL